MKTMKRKFYVLMAALALSSTILMAQQQTETDPLATGLGGVATVVGETHTATDSVSNKPGTPAKPVKPVPEWKKKFYYGYNFDIYFHHDSRSERKENGWSIALSPEIGWKLKERVYLGLRLSGSYANTVSSYSINLLDTTYNSDLRVHQGSWEVAPYVRYRMKSLFDGKVGIWLEGRVFTGMDFPRVSDGDVRGTDYDGLRHSINYGFQVSPVITYQFNRKRNFQIFFSILSLGFSGTTYCYQNTVTGERYKEHTQDIIIFSGKLKNMLANQFTPGLYGLKFGVQRSF